MIVFAGACLVAVFFAARLVLFTVYWSDPARRDAAIESWQTPGYVAMSWKVPRAVIAEAIGLSEGSAPRESLNDIAARRGVPVETLIAEIEEAIDAFRVEAE